MPIESIEGALKTLFQISKGWTGTEEELTSVRLEANSVLKSAGSAVVRDVCRRAGSYEGIDPEYWAQPEDLTAAYILFSGHLRLQIGLPGVSLGRITIDEGMLTPLAHQFKDKFPGFNFTERYLLLGYEGNKVLGDVMTLATTT